MGYSSALSTGGVAEEVDEKRRVCTAWALLWALLFVKGMMQSMSADGPHLIDGHQTRTTDLRPGETAYGMLQSHGELLAVSPALQAMAAPWGSVEVWWRHVMAQIGLPVPTQCPVCRLGQRVGVVRATLPEPLPTDEAPAWSALPRLRTFEVTFSGHPHDLLAWGARDTPGMVPPDLLLVSDRTHDQQQHETVCRTIRQYESICTFIQDVYYQMDLQGRILFISPSCRKLILYRPEELLGSFFAELLPTPDTFQELLDILQTTREVHDFYLLLHCKQGQQLPVVITAKLVAGGDGQAATIEGIFRDVSERDRLGTLLEERTQTYRHTLSLLERLKAATDQHVLISVVDPVGNILSVNDRFLSVCRYDETEVIGKNHRIFNSGHHPKSFFQGVVAHCSEWCGLAR
ncbi:MAG: PAS domain S-box protein [Magnetococcus sp. DMHC-8]